MRRAVRRLALSQIFLITAFVVVALSMSFLGNWIGVYLSASISEGVARTAAASLEALIANNLGNFDTRRPISDEERARLDAVFQIGNEADSTRLLQIRIRNLDGTTIYESFGGILATERAQDFHAAAAGNVVTRVGDLPLKAVGPLPEHSLAVLEIHTPLHRPSSGEIFALAELYYSARSIEEIGAKAKRDVWALVGIAGLVVVGILYVLVARASRTIASQRANLARNLALSRKLSEENAALHSASEKLRLDANLSNERLLARVGSDLHDGPIQLLTLVILRLSKLAGASSTPAELATQRTVRLASDAMEELRNISSGLVLPELTPLTLIETIDLAIARHEGATGTTVRRNFVESGDEPSMPVKICVFRVVQEALNNAYWHGGPATPAVSAVVENAVCRVLVTSAARSAAPMTPHREEAVALGLRGMRYRVESLGGTLEFDFEGGSHSSIIAMIPLGLVAQLPPSNEVMPTPS